MKNTLVFKTAAIFLLSGAAIIFSASFYANMAEEDTYLQAMEKFDKKDFDGARADFDGFISKFPESKYRASSLLKLAELSETIEGAEKMYAVVIKDYPGTENEAEADFSLGKLYYASADYTKAEEKLDMIISKFPNMVWIEEAIYYLMLCYYAEKKYDMVDRYYGEYRSNANFFLLKNRVNLAEADSMYAREKYRDAAGLYKEIIEKAEASKDPNIYLPLVYKKLVEADIKTGDLKAAELLESDLKYKFPGSPEAKGEKQEDISGAVEPEATAVFAAAPEKQKTRKAGRVTALPIPDKPGKFFTIQIGAYSNKKFCDLTTAKLAEKKYDVFVKQDGKFYKVMVGKFATKAEAESFAPGLAKKEKLKSYLIKQGWE